MALPAREVPNLPKYDRDNGQAGMFAIGNLPTGNATIALTVNGAYAVRFSPSRRMVITKLAFLVHTAASADDAVCVGIYDNAYARLATSGAVTGKLNSTGVKTVDLASSLALKAGRVYYAAVSSGTQGGTACSLLAHTLGNLLVCDLFGTTAGLREVGFQGAAHPLPSTLAPSSGTSVPPILAVRES